MIAIGRKRVNISSTYGHEDAAGASPRRDVDMATLTRNEHTTYCPCKGDASYDSIPAGGDRSLNAVWTYETPFEAMAQIKDLAVHARQTNDCYPYDLVRTSGTFRERINFAKSA